MTAESIFTLPRMLPRDRAIERVAGFLSRLPQDKAWRVSVAEQKRTRTQSQNALLWAIYDDVLAKGGEALRGWTKDDLHEFFLITHFGHEVRELFGRKRLVPLKRSSKLSRTEFSGLVECIVQFMANQGVYIEMPGDL